MPRKLLKRWTPDPQVLRSHKSLRFLGNLLHDPNLFHLNRHSVSMAFFVGLSVAFLPIFGHVLLAALGALALRCNLPLAITLVWISNPLSIPFIFYSCYKLGALILQLPAREVMFSFSWEWLQSEFLFVWQPLLLGSVIVSLLFGSLGYAVIQCLWRWHTISKWRHRKRKRATYS